MSVMYLYASVTDDQAAHKLAHGRFHSNTRILPLNAAR